MLAAIRVFLICIPVSYNLKTKTPKWMCCSGIWWTSVQFSRTFLLFLRFPEIHIQTYLQSLAFPTWYGDPLWARTRLHQLDVYAGWMLVGLRVMQLRPRESRGRFSSHSSELDGVWLNFTVSCCSYNQPSSEEKYWDWLQRPPASLLNSFASFSYRLID